MENPNTNTATDPADADRLAEVRQQAEADAKADAERLAAWRASVGEKCEALAAERKARAVARAQRAAAARWKDGRGPPTRAVRLYREDLEVLATFKVPFSGLRASPALAVHSMIRASKGLLWTTDESGRVVLVGPLRDLFRRG